jgi:hypothetical protein
MMEDSRVIETIDENDSNHSRPIYELSTNELQQVAGGMKNPVRVVITAASRGELEPVPPNATSRVAVVTGGIGGLGTAM